MADRLTPELLRAIEATLTPIELEVAFQFVEANGWPRGSDVPLFVWYDAFRKARIACQTIQPHHRPPLH